MPAATHRPRRGPDLYQGTEFWDFSLVDPDKPPAGSIFSARARRGVWGDAGLSALAGAWRNGRIKAGP